MSKLKNIPIFKTEAEEKVFWKKDTSECLDWKQAQLISMPNLKPLTKNVKLI